MFFYWTCDLLLILLPSEMSSCNAAKQYISAETASLLVLALLTDDVLRLKASRKEGKEGHSKMYEWLLGHWTADNDKCCMSLWGWFIYCHFHSFLLSFVMLHGLNSSEYTCVHAWRKWWYAATSRPVTAAVTHTWQTDSKYPFQHTSVFSTYTYSSCLH